MKLLCKMHAKHKQICKASANTLQNTMVFSLFLCTQTIHQQQDSYWNLLCKMLAKHKEFYTAPTNTLQNTMVFSWFLCAQILTPASGCLYEVALQNACKTQADLQSISKHIAKHKGFLMVFVYTNPYTSSRIPIGICFAKCLQNTRSFTQHPQTHCKTQWFSNGFYVHKSIHQHQDV
jgi:hypothetical protein